MIEDNTPFFNEHKEKKETTNFSNYLSDFKREQHRFKTVQPKEKIFKKEESQIKYTKLKTSPLIVISNLFSNKLITPEQRGLLKELVIDNNKTLLNYIEDFENDKDLSRLYDKLKVLLK